MMYKKNVLFLIALTLISCGPTVLVPPVIDLVPYEKVGLISFTMEKAKGNLDEMATQLFLQEVSRFQRGAHFIELGPLSEIRTEVEKTGLNQEMIKEIGKRYGVSVLFYGTITVSDVRPDIDITAFIQGIRVKANFDITMISRLYSAQNGATLWTNSVYRKGTLANVGMGPDGIPHFDLKDENETYRRLLEDMIHDLTEDFRPTKKRK